MSWDDEHGTTLSERIKLLNLADHGAMVESMHKLPLRLVVRLKVESWQIDGSATVRYCRQKGSKYRIGLELSYSIAAKPKQRRWT